MTDIEGNPIVYSRVPTAPSTTTTTTQPASIENPYTDGLRSKRTIADRILHYVKRTFYMGLSMYVLHRFFRFYNAIFHSPYILHEWFKVGIALTIGTTLCISTVDIFVLLSVIFYSSLNDFFIWTTLLALLGIKAYVEIYEGRINKATVDYKNFPQSTHAAILLILLSSIVYHIALWPHYHYNTFIVLGILFFGVVLQFMLMTPSSVQNIVSFLLLAFFIQEYQ